MAVNQLTTNLNIIQALDDEPNDVGGLSSAQLKAKFDEASNIIKTYLNSTTPLLATLTDLSSVVLGQIPDNSIGVNKLSFDPATQVELNSLSDIVASADYLIQKIKTVDGHNSGLDADTIDTKHAPSGDIVGTTDTQTLTNKTITSPKIDAIYDTNGLKTVDVLPTANAVNYFYQKNSATGGDLEFGALGTDTNISINLLTKGTGKLKLNSAEIVPLKTVIQSDTVILSADTERINTTTNTTQTVKTFTVRYGGYYRLKCDNKGDSSSCIASYRITNSGIVIASTSFAGSTGTLYETFTANPTAYIPAGSIIEFQVANNAGNYGYLKNAKVCGTVSIISDAVTLD